MSHGNDPRREFTHAPSGKAPTGEHPRVGCDEEKAGRSGGVRSSRDVGVPRRGELRPRPAYMHPRFPSVSDLAVAGRNRSARPLTSAEGEPHLVFGAVAGECVLEFPR